MFVRRVTSFSSLICPQLVRGPFKWHNQFVQNNRRLVSNKIQQQSSVNAKVAANIPNTAIDQNSKKPIENKLTIIEKLPNVRITRKIVGSKDKTNLNLILFQYQTCPFCCKVRVFLDSKGFSYSVVEVDAVLRQDTKWSTYKKVPMMLAQTKDGKYVQLTDSSAIVSILATVLDDPKADIVQLAECYSKAGTDRDGKHVIDLPESKYHLLSTDRAANKNTENERKWRAWTDSHLINLISPNVYGTPSEALETFNWFSNAGKWDLVFPRWERHLMVYSGAAIMYLISKRLKKRHNLSDDVRSHIYDACNQWIAELKSSPYHGGHQPNLADLAVFGALNSFEGCQAFTDIKKNTQIEPWFNAVRTYVEKNRGAVVNGV